MREHYYVDVSTVRKYEAAPKRQPNRRPEVQPERRTRVEPKRNQQKALSMGKGQAAFLGVAMAMILVACVYMLNLQAAITVQNKNIATLETTLNTIVNDNEATASRLESQVDLSKIYTIATQELGMVYADSGQIVVYEQSDPDYVRQYADVPEMN